jgi:hypothetical protein
VPIKRHEPKGTIDKGSCIEGSPRAAAGAGSLATVYYISFTVAKGDQSLYAGASAQADAQPVSGVGTKAVFLPSAGALFGLTGAAEFEIQVVKGGKPGTQADCIAVANVLLTNL